MPPELDSEYLLSKARAWLHGAPDERLGLCLEFDSDEHNQAIYHYFHTFAYDDRSRFDLEQCGVHAVMVCLLGQMEDPRDLVFVIEAILNRCRDLSEQEVRQCLASISTMAAEIGLDRPAEWLRERCEIFYEKRRQCDDGEPGKAAE